MVCDDFLDRFETNLLEKNAQWVYGIVGTQVRLQRSRMQAIQTRLDVIRRQHEQGQTTNPDQYQENQGRPGQRPVHYALHGLSPAACRRFQFRRQAENFNLLGFTLHRVHSSRRKAEIAHAIAQRLKGGITDQHAGGGKELAGE